MNRRTIFWTFATTLLLMSVTSCKDDYFDEERYEKIMRDAFPVANVDPQHTWSTIGSAELSVEVNLRQGETYAAKVYDQNPIGATGGLNLLGEGTVKNGSVLTTVVNYPLSLDHVFVALFDQKGYMTVYPVAIADGKASLQVGGAQAAMPASARRKVQDSHDVSFPDPPADGLFKTSVPQGAKSPNDYYMTQSGDYVMDESIRQPNFWNGNCNIYFPSGQYDLNSFAINNNTNIYLLPGATVQLSSFAFKYARVNIVIAEGATLKGDVNATVSIYNRGTIETGTFILYSSYNPWWADPNASDGFFYNEGTLTASTEYHLDDRCQTVNDGDMQVARLVIDEDAQFLNRQQLGVTGHLGVENTRSLFINEGTASAASVGVAGSADFYNDAVMTVSGETTVSSNQATWHNDGEYTTQRFTYTAGSTDVINNCHMVVTDRFYIGLGDTDSNNFTNNGGASVQTRDFEFSGPGFIRMGSGSLFQVTGTAYMAITKDVYGFYGPETGDYAVLQAKDIVRRQDISPNQGFVANYFGHLYVACDSHFPFGYSDKSAEQQAAGEVGSQPYYRLDAASGAQMTTYNGADVHVVDNGCGAAYDGEPDEEPEAQSFSLRYCFEDNFPEMGDYDLNDAVITVTPTTDGTAVVKLRVSLDAVGATEQIAAALRIKGLADADVVSCTREGNLDADFPTYASLRIIDTDQVMVPRQLRTSDDVTLLLFNNAHWTLGRTISAVGSVENMFLNTVKRDNPFESKRNDVEPAVATYTFTLSEAAKASLFTQDHIDVFIVEGYNGGYWEVHTVPFKTDEVIAPYVKGVKDKFGDNIPWAICVPGNDFKYPVEWQCIGIKEGSVITGAYQEYGHSFAEWAVDHTKATDWYKYPTEGLVYE